VRGDEMGNRQTAAADSATVPGSKFAVSEEQIVHGQWNR